LARFVGRHASECYLFVLIMPDLELGLRRCRALDFVTLFVVKEMYSQLLLEKKKKGTNGEYNEVTL
jgi:hypothetical protein